LDEPDPGVTGLAGDKALVTSEGMADPLLALDSLADWSPWTPFGTALDMAPRLPGVYLAREATTKALVYVGMAGERRGSKDRPQGLRGRLSIYTTGKGLASGLGEAVLDRALADADWLRARATEAELGEPMRAKRWGVAALERADLEVRWAVTADKASALKLERECLTLLAQAALWNRYR
jgi:hypothetical protein